MGIVCFTLNAKTENTFTTFCASTILRRNNNREFTKDVVKVLRNMWIDLKIAHGKPRHSQSQGSVECLNVSTRTSTT